MLAFVALLCGAFVVLLRKGTPLHRKVGWAYFGSMVGLNLTALLIYNLFGDFGPFHWLALASLITLLVGIVPVVRKKPANTWLFFHAEFMSWSYLGLLAAAVSEVSTRMLDFPFGWTVAITSLLVLVVGSLIIKRTVPKAISRFLGNAGLRAGEKP